MSREGELARIAARQAGAFHRSQAVTAGYSADQIGHRLKQRHWTGVLPCVYRFTATPATAQSRRWSAWLWAGQDALLSHRTAAELWKFDGVAPSERVHVIVGRGRRLRSTIVDVHRTDVPVRLDRRHVDGLPVTSPEMTLIHLAPTLTGEALEAAFESARRERLVTSPSLERCVARIAAHGRSGIAPVRTLLEVVGAEPAAESLLEVKVARLVRRERVVPQPVRQHAVDGFRVDFAWPHLKVALECDGRRNHSDHDDFQRDRTKWSVLAALGWRVLVVTWDDVVRRPGDVVGRLVQALACAA
jgi:very-short-patch-repair endonuclease